MKLSRRWRLGILTGLMGTLLVTGGMPIAQNSQASTTMRVRVLDNLYRPKAITIHVGTRIKWVNRGSNHHTVTRSRLPGRWDSGDLAPGAVLRHTFRQVGTFKYFCKYHRLLGMRGKVVVVR